ncbi:hypothetical protein GCK72_025014 [Caenorhabditis remanei]|uniref:Uncharacterized protein n=1 Tax=Caenorhabditis remanei TaxID=31234 RepID=A0A6A5G0S2_CAERE|nr:hypothetical protein GCK72_025014 [Caenorhabditis remanei]KAF1748547.1 hypothetical protein GCK72_025014 [Caenorhabditis remanei]
MTSEEFHQCRRNFSFAQCRILQWTLRSTSFMLFAMTTYGVDSQSRLFLAHLWRHQLLCFMFAMGVNPYSEQFLVEDVPHLLRSFRRAWRRCERELARY